MVLDPTFHQQAASRAPNARASATPQPGSSVRSRGVVRAQCFCLSRHPAPSVGLTVVDGGREQWRSGCEVAQHDGGRYPTLELMAQGLGGLSLAGRSYALVPGMLYAHGPGIPVIVTGSAGPFVKYVVSFTGPEASALLERHGPAPGSVTYTSAPHDLRELFEELIRVGARNTALSPRIAALVLERLVLRGAETSVQRAQVGGAAFMTYLRCRKHIDERWGAIATLEQLASECDVDPAYVCRLFRRFDQQTPYQYLLSQKVKHAARRLVEGGVSVKEVAHGTGFRDPLHFSRAFRKLMGLPPGRYAAQRGHAPAP